MLQLVAGLVGGGLSFLGGRSAGRSAERAANASAAVQREGLQYMMQQDAAPTFYRDQALAALAAEYGLTPYSPNQDDGDVIENGQPVGGYSQEEIPRLRRSVRIGNKRIARSLDQRQGQSAGFLSQAADSLRSQQTSAEPSPAPTPSRSITEMAYDSPLYRAIMSARDAGEQAIARTSSATGGLRGGQSISDLATFNRDLENRAFLESRSDVLRGLGSMAGYSGLAPQIAQGYSNIGQTLGQGQVAAAQARQDGLSGLAQGIGMGVQSYYGSRV